MPDTLPSDASVVPSHNRESEELFRTLGEAFSDIIWMSDAQGRLLYQNPAWCRYAGKSHEDMLAGRWMDQCHPDDLPFILALWEEIIHGARPAEYEARLRRHDGVYRWFAARVKPVRVDDGRQQRWVAVMTDIHERRFAEKRQAFLLRLADALRPLVEPVQVQTTACRLVAEFLDVARVSFADIENDCFSVCATHVRKPVSYEESGRVADYGGALLEAFHRGETIVVSDIPSDPRFTPDERAGLARLGLSAYLAVSLIRQGSWVGGFAVDSDLPRDWTPDEISLVRDVAERVWSTTERVRVEEALRLSEEKYRTLFDSIDEGFCLVQMICDAAGRPYDYRFLEINAAFEKHTGFKGARGRTILELNPAQEDYWFEIYGRIDRTGQPERFENVVRAIGRIFDVFAFRMGTPGAHQVAILFNDITERRRRESHLAFLADISEGLVRLGSASETMQVIGERLGRFLGASACVFVEVDIDGGCATVLNEWRRHPGLSLIGRYTLADYFTPGFFREMSAGVTVAVNDVCHDPRVRDLEAFSSLEIGAFVNVPLTREGRWNFTFAVHHDRPHSWREDELALIEETFVRVWNKLERVRVEEALAADLRSTQILRDLGARLAPGTGFQELFDQINAAAMQLTDAEAGTVQIYDPATRELILISTHGFPPDSLQRFGRLNADSATSCGLALAAGRRTFLDFDDPSIADPKGDLRWHLDAGYRSAQSTPLIARSGLPIGMLSTHWRKPHRPTEWQLHHIDLLARQAADLIEQREAADRLRENEARLRTLFNSMGEGFLIMEAIPNVEGRPVDYLLIECNPAFSSHTGLDDPRGRRLLELVPDFDPQWLHRCERVLSSGHSASFDGYVPSLDRWLSISASRLGSESHRLAILFSDITSRRASETMLVEALRETEQARAEAEQASRAKDHFLAILSHELRTPLTPVVMTTSAIQRRPDLDPSLRKGLEIIERNIRTECHLIDDLLDVTRIGRGKMEIVSEPLDLHEIIRGAVEVSEPDLAKKEQQLSVLLQASRTAFEGDATRLKQAIWNILKNASKFTPPAGSVRISSHDAGENVVVQISDSGMGIPAEKLGAIFRAFAQADESVTRVFGGLGLGLAIAKAIIEAHGGVIFAESPGQGRGATFTLELPSPSPSAPSTPSQIESTLPNSSASASPSSVPGVSPPSSR